ncbi:hypothetical protein NPIL_314391 [Nephila pilipes]|uniref:Uncharacterized protein n=1 Tax=Nephila pilipes TaxID=299642 RepID=A0A8X6PFN3_NEPPI|nr:hypothetical protein NPIL_314391 [Nephila pilipes]
MLRFFFLLLERWDKREQKNPPKIHLVVLKPRAENSHLQTSARKTRSENKRRNSEIGSRQWKRKKKSGAKMRHRQGKMPEDNCELMVFHSWGWSILLPSTWFWNALRSVIIVTPDFGEVGLTYAGSQMRIDFVLPVNNLFRSF